VGRNSQSELQRGAPGERGKLKDKKTIVFQDRKKRKNNEKGWVLSRPDLEFTPTVGDRCTEKSRGQVEGKNQRGIKGKGKKNMEGSGLKGTCGD